jgi:hypothetical protein
MAGCDYNGDGTVAFFDPSRAVSAPAPFSDRERRYDTCADGVATNPQTGDQLVTFAKNGVHAVMLDAAGLVKDEVTVAPRGADAAVAFDPRLDEFFVAWADRGVIRGKRLSATGAPLGAGVSRVSDRTSDNTRPDARLPQFAGTRASL